MHHCPIRATGGRPDRAGAARMPALTCLALASRQARAQYQSITLTVTLRWPALLYSGKVCAAMASASALGSRMCAAHDAPASGSARSSS